ncbi:MAG: hypothetical protein ACYC26_07635 [Phycisphaerales bacterium]
MNPLIARIKRQLIADRKKVGAMLCLLSVALLLWGRLLLKDVPRTAVAQPGAAVAATGSAPAAAAKSSADKNARIEIVLPQFPMSHRDLFAFDPGYFPSIETPVGNTSVVDKSDAKSTDDSFRRQQLELAVQAQAKSLALQSTLLGDVSRAMISGNLLEVGQSIQGFTLKEVRSRAVVLEKDGVQVILEM